MVECVPAGAISYKLTNERISIFVTFRYDKIRQDLILRAHSTRKYKNRVIFIFMSQGSLQLRPDHCRAGRHLRVEPVAWHCSLEHIQPTYRMAKQIKADLLSYTFSSPYLCSCWR